MEFFNKYKKIIIFGVIISTIIALVVYYLSHNSDDYEDFEEKMNVQQNNIVVNEIQKIKVHISGEVMNPGVVEIEDGARVIDAINIAGGLTEEADIRMINLAGILEDATKINIPNINDEEEIVIEDVEEKVMVNINTANTEELQKINGIGLSTAQKIVQYRKENGKFNSIEDLRNISGIGDSKFEKIKDSIYVK